MFVVWILVLLVFLLALIVVLVVVIAVAFPRFALLRKAIGLWFCSQKIYDFSDPSWKNWHQIECATLPDVLGQQKRRNKRLKSLYYYTYYYSTSSSSSRRVRCVCVCEEQKEGTVCKLHNPKRNEHNNCNVHDDRRSSSVSIVVVAKNAIVLFTWTSG